MRIKNHLDLLLASVTFCLLSTSALLGQTVDQSRVGSKPLPFPMAGSIAAGCNDGWDTSFTTNGADREVKAIVSDGAGNYYFGGAFDLMGVEAHGIAKWDGTTWTPLGSGVDGTVNAIAIVGNDVYIGGGFSVAGGNPANGVAKWDGTSWSALGSGLGGGTHEVHAIAVLGSDIYFGGNFHTVDGSPASGMARWDGTSWSAVGALAPSARTLVVKDGKLYAGDTGGVRMWDGTSWTTLGSLTGTATGLAFKGDELWAVGTMTLAGNSATVAKWDGTTWTRVAGSFGSNVWPSSIAFVGSDVYLGGNFTRQGGQSVSDGLLKQSGTTWAGVGTGTVGANHTVRVLLASGNTLYAGGSFDTAGGVAARNIATLSNGTTWAGFSGTGLDRTVTAVAVSGTDVYVGGTFVGSGPVTSNGIAKWNALTNTWSALGSGIVGGVSAISVAGGKVYAAGVFSNIGGITASNIAVWNGANWSPLGSGVNGWVTSMLVRGSDIYVGGDFTIAGGVTANRVAKWNGVSWSGLSSSILPTTVASMAFLGNDLYVATTTTTIPNPAYFSKYDGTTWTPLGADLGDSGVGSLAVLGNDIYVTGGFTSINGVTVNHIAKWNGSAWSALGGGLPTAVGQPAGVRLTVSGSDLIATGNFTAATGPAERIARWNGVEWSALGTGLNSNGNAITSAGGDIFVGGAFTRAGCNFSPYFARYRNTVWTGGTNTDWHTSTNWGNGSVPPANAGITISSNNSSITSADVSLSSLIVGGGRTLTVGSGRTLTVSGNVDISSGTLLGPGSLVVNGDLNLLGGNVTGMGSITVNGNLHLGSGIVSGGPISVTSCRPGAITGGNNSSYVLGQLSRCVAPAAIYRFQVGTGSAYSPVDLVGVVGSGPFTVEAKPGAYSGPADGLPANRLQSWWQLTNGGITSADVDFYYSDADVMSLEYRYRAFQINGGTATQVSTVLDPVANRARVNGLTSFSTWTLAEGISTLVPLEGRITYRGRGADNVIVTLKDEDGNFQTARATPTGYYRFLNTPTIRPYTLTFKSKRYKVLPRTVMFDGEGPVNVVAIDL